MNSIEFGEGELFLNDKFIEKVAARIREEYSEIVSCTLEVPKIEGKIRGIYWDSIIMDDLIPKRRRRSTMDPVRVKFVYVEKPTTPGVLPDLDEEGKELKDWEQDLKIVPEEGDQVLKEITVYVVDRVVLDVNVDPAIYRCYLRKHDC